VVIRSSAARDVDQLLKDLQGTSAVRREAALARLRVLGSRALARLERLLRDGDEDARATALRVLDGMEDPRVIDLALAALGDASQTVRTNAVLALRPWVTREAGTRVMEGLVACALTDQTVAVRDAARDALALLPREIIQPILEQPVPPAADELPEDAGAVEAGHVAHPQAPLSALHALITRMHAAEQRTEGDMARLQHLVARGAVHAVLASRTSPVALYDLRETFDAATTPLPLNYLMAITTIGDAACLESLGKAWAATPSSETWWRDRLSEAAAAIAARLKLTKRHAARKRVDTKWPGFMALRKPAANRAR
jgi:hypothetical protein